MRKLSELNAVENAAIQKIAALAPKRSAVHAMYVLNCEIILCAIRPQNQINAGLLLLAAKEFYNDCNLERAVSQYLEDAKFEQWCSENKTKRCHREQAV